MGFQFDWENPWMRLSQVVAADVDPDIAFSHNLTDREKQNWEGPRKFWLIMQIKDRGTAQKKLL